ncbi:hypothetical protein CUMW_244520 [Citrus unshiu]|uniref:RNase H type-1 domain-containing protein n=1 Tax=Citrus unshiu TaxID=55188 RepID=A0A2H5QMQ3_CITUN|nr:hypothetical protein CUMW_244520 [Citrus unshiu]
MLSKRNLNEIFSGTKQFTHPSILKENAAPEAEAVSTVATSTGAASASSTTVSLPSQPLSRSSDGVGITTNNVAKYGSLILGLKYALQKGFFNFRVRGDSKLVHMQPCKLILICTSWNACKGCAVKFF